MDRNIEIGVKTTLANGRVEQTIDGLTKRVVDIAAQHQEAALRKALVQLGWTPPEESEELRRDSERYRWLRTNPPNARVWFEHDDGFGADSFEGDDFDAAIDSARGVIDADRKEGV
jgi:hypothetical protein